MTWRPRLLASRLLMDYPAKWRHTCLRSRSLSDPPDIMVRTTEAAPVRCYNTNNQGLTE